MIRHLEVADSTWNRWRNQYDGMEADEANRHRQSRGEAWSEKVAPLEWFVGQVLTHPPRLSALGLPARLRRSNPTPRVLHRLKEILTRSSEPRALRTRGDSPSASPRWTAAGAYSPSRQGEVVTPSPRRRTGEPPAAQALPLTGRVPAPAGRAGG